MKNVYIKNKYYRFSSICESIISICFSLITKNYKLKSYKIFLYKLPIKSTVFYNKLGIIILFLKVFFIHFFNFKNNTLFKFSTKKNLMNDKIIDEMDEYLWPVPKLCKYRKLQPPSDKFYEKLSNNYILSYRKDNLKFSRGEWWSTFTKNFSKLYFDENKKLKRKLLEEDLFLTNLGVDLLRDSSALTNLNKVQTYFKIIEIIGNYHDLYDVCLPEFLMNSSESKIFNSNTIIYRNQLISTRLLRCVYYLSQIKKSTDLTYDKKFIFLDIGGGFGCLSRLILNFFYNSKGILIDLPETNILAASYLTQNFPEKKIKFLSDLNEISILNPSFFNDADFLILPPWAISLIDNNSIDLVINTASLGEMSIDYGEYYLKNINRICKKYFYSHNRKNSKNSIWDGFGHYNFQFEHEWNTILYNSSLGWHLEFLGEKKL